MKKRLLIVLTLLICASVPAYAAPVLVDFEGVAPGAYQGFVFEGEQSATTINIDSGALTASMGIINAEFNVDRLKISRADGTLFGLSSIDILYFPGGIWSPPGGSIISAFDSGGQLIAWTRSDQPTFSEPVATVTFDAIWTGISYVTMTPTTDTGFFPGLMIDNLSATVVPIPAAVWLFGSALAGLGWLRRKQTA